MVSASFGAGRALFTSALGTALAAAGQFVGLPQIKGVVFAIGGAIGYSYALGELFDVPLRFFGPCTADGAGRQFLCDGFFGRAAFRGGRYRLPESLLLRPPFVYFGLGKAVTGAALGFCMGSGQ